MDFFQPSRITFWLVILLSSQPLFAQTNTFPTSGNVGIGVTNPRTDLVVGSTFGASISGSGGGRGLFGSNLAIFSSGANVNALYTPYTHSNNYGYSGIMSSWGKIYFYTSAGNTTQDQIVTPVARMFINTNGNVGIGTSNPAEKLHVIGNTSIDDGNIFLNYSTYSKGGLYIKSTHYGNQYKWWQESDGLKLAVYNSSDYTTPVNPSLILFRSAGNQVEVNGKIRSKEVIVEATGWPDYVFEEDYDLPTLAEIEAYIKTHKHLPGIPSAEQVEEQGLTLGEMNALLLKKIEELTLHIIEQEKRIKKLESNRQ